MKVALILLNLNWSGGGGAFHKDIPNGMMVGSFPGMQECKNAANGAQFAGPGVNMPNPAIIFVCVQSQ
jgi:hypothetical protein